ncbi:PAS domain-containing sensor histidine kinase [Cohnella lupini]|nr:PAS domain-containing sensor histidine kinase [Cohnella lupini]
MKINNNYFTTEINEMLVLNSFLNLTSDAVYVIDLNGRIMAVNKKFEELHGWTREEIVGKEIPMSAEDREISLEIFHRILNGEQVTVLEAAKISNNGSFFYADVTISPVKNEEGMLVALVVIERDITDRKQAEDLLRESEERYRVLVDCSPEPIVVCHELIIVFVNPAAVKLLGANSSGELIGQHASRFLLDETMLALPKYVDELLKGGKASEGAELSLIRTDGKIIHVEYRAVPINLQGVKSVQLLFRDVTDRKKAESELADKEMELSRILQLSPEPILLHQAGRITFVNDRGIELLNGTKKEEFVGLPIIDFFCASCHPLILERMRKVVQIDDYMEFVEMKLKRLDGELIDVEVASICVHRNIRAPIVQVVIRDLTERKKTEEMIRRSDKLSIAGELAAGVAHEIRNPLTALRGFMQLLSAKKTDYVDIMLVEIDRINHIVNEFIGMAKPQALNFIRCDIRDLMDNVIIFLHPQALLYNVELKITIQAPISPIECEPNQIKQVFMNVLKNAIESMPQGGEVEIVIAMKEDRDIIVRIVDQGVGIPEDRMEKIGEPFFSLKESGTGLGLMVCHRIIEAHQGRITISSVVNEGTTVEIELPSKGL